MKQLILYEFRKLMPVKWLCVCLCVMCVFPMIFAYFGGMQTYNDATSRYYEQYKGEVTPEWYQTIEQDAAEINEMVANKQASRFDGQGEDATMEEYAKRDVLANAQSMAYKVLRGEEETYNTGYITGLDQYEAYQKERELYVKTTMQDAQPYYFGNPQGHEFLYYTLWYGGIMMALFLLFVMSRLFNCEQNGKFIEVLKTTKEGQRRVCVAKMLTGVLFPLAYTCVCVMIYLLVTLLFFHPDFDISFMSMGKGTLAPFQFKELALYGTLLYVTGTCACAVIALCFSSLFRSSFLSLCASLLFFLVPIFFQKVIVFDTSITAFLPGNFLLFNNTMSYEPWVFLQGNGFFYGQIIPVIWVVGMLLLSLLIYLKFQRRATE